MSGAPPLLITSTLTPEQLQALQTLVRDATRADGVPPVREQVLLQLPSAGAGRSILAFDPDAESLLGYAHLDDDHSAEGPAVEIAVHPAARNQGIGTALLDEVLALCPPAPSPIRLWAHGENAAAAQLARNRGFRQVRHLYQMRRSLSSDLPEMALPTGVAIRTFDPDLDVPALQRLNAATFTELPDQGGWTEDDIRMRIAEDWFDAEGLLLATAGRRLVGFHWTKIVRRSRANRDLPDQSTFGEVYVLGVHPSAGRRGLGRALTLAGLHYMRDQGLTGAQLYVDASNVPANALYTSLGFTVWDSDVLFRR